ncbi:MAG: phosphoribosyl-ATP diphosphatase [Tissierellia bacterium]|nr:phosphoribosyl-ATP diphosphatase [Tissierellia bacterium]
MEVFKELYNTILERKADPQEGSYTSYLFKEGKEKILKKLGEESTEVVIAGMKGSKDEIVAETGDLLYHLMVLLAEEGIPWEDIVQEMEVRRQKTGNFKGERREIKNY